MSQRLARGEALPRIEIAIVARIYRAFGRYYRPQARTLAVSLVGLVLTIATTLLTPWPLKLILDHVVLQHPLPARARFIDLTFPEMVLAGRDNIRDVVLFPALRERS